MLLAGWWQTDCCYTTDQTDYDKKPCNYPINPELVVHGSTLNRVSIRGITCLWMGCVATTIFVFNEKKTALENSLTPDMKFRMLAR
jgi:hypothetical protein